MRACSDRGIWRVVRGSGLTGAATFSLRTGAGDRIASTRGFSSGRSAEGAGSEGDGPTSYDYRNAPSPARPEHPYMKFYTAASHNMPNPRDFFENIVKPSYEAWLADHLREWKAKAATSNADTMAERIFVYWNNRDQTHVAGARHPREYRSHLRTNVCPDFGLVWDVPMAINTRHLTALIDKLQMPGKPVSGT
jgi:hypothetical protein